MRQTGLRTEILVNIIFITAVAMFLIGIIAFKITERSALGGNIEGLKSIISALEGSYLKKNDVAGGVGFLKEALNPGASGVLDYGNERVYFSTSGIEGDRAESDALLLQAEVSGNTVIEVEGMNFPPFSTYGGIRIASPVRISGGGKGALVIYQPLTSLEESLALNQKLIALWIMLFLVVIALFGFYILSRRIVRPVHELIRTTEKISAGKFREEADIGNVKEINQLYSALRKMYYEIESGKRKLSDKITELEETNAELRQTQGELIASEKLASLGRLSAGVAHEIGNPLSAINGYLEVLRRAPDMDDIKRAGFLGEIQREVGRIDAIIRTLIDYSRPKKLSLEALDPNQAITRTADIVKSQGILKDISLKLDLAPDVPLIEADAGRLSQVIINLILNSRDAIKGAGEIVISTAAGAGRSVIISVRDDGAGIPEEIKDKIFDPFFTTKDPGHGTGLGLSVSARIIEDFKGRIEVGSEPGKGTIFNLIFPAAGDYRNAENFSN